MLHLRTALWQRCSLTALLALLSPGGCLAAAHHAQATHTLQSMPARCTWAVPWGRGSGTLTCFARVLSVTSEPPDSAVWLLFVESALPTLWSARSCRSLLDCHTLLQGCFCEAPCLL